MGSGAERIGMGPTELVCSNSKIFLDPELNFNVCLDAVCREAKGSNNHYSGIYTGKGPLLVREDFKLFSAYNCEQKYYLLEDRWRFINFIFDAELMYEVDIRNFRDLTSYAKVFVQSCPDACTPIDKEEELRETVGDTEDITEPSRDSLARSLNNMIEKYTEQMGIALASYFTALTSKMLLSKANTVIRSGLLLKGAKPAVTTPVGSGFSPMLILAPQFLLKFATEDRVGPMGPSA